MASKAKQTSKAKSVKATKKAATVAKTKAVNVELPLCLCGCGARVKYANRLFIQGHDQRTRGFLQRFHRGNPLATDTDMDTIAALCEERGMEVASVMPEDLAFAIGGQDWVDSLGEKGSKIPKQGAAKAKGGADLEPFKVKLVAATRKVGRWAKQGHIDGDRFIYTDASGEEHNVALSSTKPV